MDTQVYATKIKNRLAELGARIVDVESELSHEMTKDLEDQAVDLEDDEVLEAIGNAAQQEIKLLNEALGRIGKGTYGTCPSCGDPISTERLDAIPYAVLCQKCATGNVD